MSLKILNRTYTDPYNSNPTNPTDWLLANIGDWLKAKFLIEAGIDFTASSSEPLGINTEDKTIKLMNGKKWSDYGFDIGDTVTMQYVVQTLDLTNPDADPSSESVEFEFEILQLFNDTIVYDEAGALAELGYDNIPTERSDKRVFAVKLFVDKEMQGANIKYNLLPNSQIDANVLSSFIDGMQTEAIFNGIDTLGSGIGQMTLIPKQSGMAVRQATIRKVTSGEGDGSASFTIPQYTIDMSFNAATQNKVAESIFISKTAGNNPPYHTVGQGVIPMTPPGNYSSGVSPTMFLDSAIDDGARYVAIDMFFKIITNNNGGGTNPKLRLILNRYTGGAAYTFAEKTVLSEWSYTNSIRGQLLHYANILTLNVVTGESYIIGFESSQENNSVGGFPLTRSFRLQTVSGSVNVETGLTDSSYKRKYEITFDFMVHPFFEELANLQTLSPPEILLNDNSITDNIEIKLFPEWNNPNTFIKNLPEQTERLGNVGWFNENYNALPNPFTVESVKYFDLGGAQADRLSYGADIKVKALISGFTNLQLGTPFRVRLQFTDQPTPGAITFAVLMPDTTTLSINKTFISSGSPTSSQILTSGTLDNTINLLLASLNAYNYNSNVVYTRDADSIYLNFIASGSYSYTPTTIPAQITATSATDVAGNVFKYGFIWIPNEIADYKEKDTPFHQNTKINCPDDQGFGFGIYPYFFEGFAIDDAKMNVKDVSFVNDNGKVRFEATFSPTAEFAAFYSNREGDRNYALWLSVADVSQEANLSNRVALLLDVAQMDLFIPVEGELPGLATAFIEHPEAETVPGVGVYDGFIEDDVLARVFFPLPVNTRLNQMVIGYEVENLTTLESYELERFTANLSGFITDIAGIQQIDFSASRNYKFAPGFNKNLVKISRVPSSDSLTSSGYQLLFGQKIRWEDWLQRANVPVEFYDPALPFNGAENNWLDYLRASENHKVSLFVQFDLIVAGAIHRYKNTFIIKFNGYDENTEVITTEHQYFNNATNALLNIAGNDPITGRPLGVLLSSEKTRIEITYTKVSGNFTAGEFYAITTIEIDGGAGALEHRQLSSIIGSEGDNILIPLTGETKLKTELIAPNKLKTSCLVDNNRLSPASRYKITGRLGCFLNDGGAPVVTQIYENKYELKYQ